MPHFETIGLQAYVPIYLFVSQYFLFSQFSLPLTVFLRPILAINIVSFK